jgi:argininosuccinate lyase
MKRQSAKRETTVGVISADVLAFTAGKDVQLDLALVEADCLGTAAHVTMLSRLPVRPPVIRPRERALVLGELAKVVEQARAGKFRITLEDQDVHLAVERTLTARLGDLGKKVHTARSRNDQVALDLRLYGREQLLGVLGESACLAETLLAFARRHAMVPMVGRTHMQPAMPSSVGLWASAFTEELSDGMDLLLAAYHINNKSPLGSAASFGVPLPIDRQLVSDLLGFSEPCHNVLYANNSRGRVECVILSALSQVMLTLSRLAQDLMLFTMPEFNYFVLPADYCTGSSIMPQKKNPDVCELVRAKAARVQGCATAIYDLLKGLPTGYNRDLQEAKEPFLEGMATTRASLRIMTGLVGGMGINEPALLKGFSPDVFATDRAIELVVGGMPFRDAYHHVKAHLDELAAVDPYKAVRNKVHLGAPAGLDFAKLGRRPASVASFVVTQQRMLRQVTRKLLGV